MSTNEEQYELASDTKLETKDLEVQIVQTIEDVPAGTIKNALVRLSVTDSELAKVKSEVKAVLQTWDGTKKSYEAIKRARLDLVPKRTAIVKEAKAGREEAISVQKLWIGAEKALTGFYAELESECAEFEEKYLAEERRVAEEKAQKERDRIQGLVNQLTPYEWEGNELILAQATPEEFADILSKAKERFAAIEAGRRAEAEREEREARELAEANRKEAERLAKIEADQKAEAEKLRKEREDFERQKREAQEAANRAERERLAKIAEDERKAREAAEAEANRLKDAADARAKEEAELAAKRAEEAHLAALAPDKEKLEAVARGLESTWAKLDLGLTSEEAQGAYIAAETTLKEVIRILRSVK
ncbi:hypothetical protein [Tetrasphaera phage TJE1]|uniref:Uncharacterized protein n=1 Tax=Tetrasphaera phage TJE1 TaxID=981335 RepID=G4W984_9CAUD|nr:hypothetical protein G185_gp52 [Tetrasphaera phage TJE1]ADX42572.1 hypothetical protein [Tetrasphaera phage TJE1]